MNSTAQPVDAGAGVIRLTAKFPGYPLLHGGLKIVIFQDGENPENSKLKR